MEGISYELAKELKDAGFPKYRDKELTIVDGVFINPPALSELIEACGEEFMQLHKIREDHWWAGDIAEEGKYASGKTPEEAVARLWLKLQQ